MTNQDEARAQVQSAKAITMAPISITLAACYVELVILVGRTIHYQKRSPRMALQSERERERDFVNFPSVSGSERSKGAGSG